MSRPPSHPGGGWPPPNEQPRWEQPTQNRPHQDWQPQQNSQPQQNWQPQQDRQPRQDQQGWQPQPGSPWGGEPIHPGQYQPYTQQRPPRRGMRLALTAGVVVLVLAVAGGVFLFTRGSSDSDKGGAASPQQAVLNVAEAVHTQDVNALLGQIDPAESRSLGALVSAARSKLSASKIVAASGALLPWLSVVTKDVQLTSTQVRDDLAFVTVKAGTITVTGDPSKAPKAFTNGETTKQTQTADLAQGLNGTRIGLVQVGGRWYFSPTTTALEAIRRANDLPQPQFDKPTALTGGDSPEAAVTGLVNAVGSRNLQAAAGYISGKELPALPYYYATFVDELTNGRNAVEVGGLQLATQDMTNGLKKVLINGVGVNAGNGRTITYGNDCVTAGDGAKRCLTPAQTTLIGASQPFAVVEQNQGKWQVSPIATVVEYLREAATNGSVDALWRISDQFQLAPVAATIATGRSLAVPLNEAGFAHIVITGRAGQCFSIRVDGSADYGVTSAGPSTASCAGFVMPDDGSADAYVLRDQFEKGTVHVTVG